MFEKVSKATLKIQCGDNSGSGFHFIKNELIITNYHVIKSHITENRPVQAITEQGDIAELAMLFYSDDKHFDYAVFQAKNEIFSDRTILIPKESDCVPRGTEVCFGGYPHGINDLLVHKAFVSGPFNGIGFYIDGSVNGGNSGGPIVDISDGSVIGIITQRRFLGGKELQEVGKRAEELRSYCGRIIAGKGEVFIMGINFTQFATLMSESFLISNSIINANANAGIGIGFHIKFVAQECRARGIL